MLQVPSKKAFIPFPTKSAFSEGSWSPRVLFRSSPVLEFSWGSSRLRFVLRANLQKVVGLFYIGTSLLLCFSHQKLVLPSLLEGSLCCLSSNVLNLFVQAISLDLRIL